MEQIARQSAFFLVTLKDSGVPLGFVQAYNLNAQEGWCFTSAFIVSDYRRGPHAAEAYIALLEYLFRSFPFRKVYADVFAFNMDAYQPLMAGGFVEEGCFKQHTWHDDRYWDVHRLAMYRERWYEVRDRARRLLGIQEEAAELLAERDGHHDAVVPATSD
jgi:RimJ/RimL family protein N-acetyltransferase